MKIRIAFTHEFCWPYVRRGGERYLHELASALARRGHDVTILAGAPISGVERQDVTIRRIKRGVPGRGLDDARFMAELSAHLVKGRFDIVHSLGPRDAVASLRAKRIRPRQRTVYTNLGIPVKEWWDVQPEGRAHARVVDQIDAYGCLSSFALEQLKKDYGRSGVLTPGGVDTRAFKPIADRRPSPTLLYSGVVDEPRKGVKTLLDALPLIARDEPDVALWLSGPGDPGRLLADAPVDARSRTEVLPLGVLEDQPARYSAAWATVLVSMSEAFGLVLIESLACGTPIVAADHSSLPELITPGTGRLAALNDVEATAASCIEVFELTRDPATTETCRRAAAAYDWDAAVAPAVEEIYLSLL